MYGAIIGDTCGSIYEFRNRKTNKPEEIDIINPACYFTDDSVLTFAVAEALLGKRDYKSAIHIWANNFPKAGYGGMFCKWITSKNPQPYNSFGNGSAMRVSPVGWTFDSLEETVAEAKRSAECTHNHPEGIKGAQSVAAAIFLARQGKTKQEIKDYIVTEFGYNLNRTLDEIRPDYGFDETCQGSVPEAIVAFLESKNFVHAIQSAISIGGDTDTVACITGSIAEAFYKDIPKELIDFISMKITSEMQEVLAAFHSRYGQ